MDPLRDVGLRGRARAEDAAVLVEFDQGQGGRQPAEAARGDVVGGEFDQAVHLVAERSEDRNLREAVRQRGGAVQQPVVPRPGVPLLVGEHRVELAALEAAQRGGGDHQLRGSAGQPPGVRPLALQDDEPVRAGLLAGEQRSAVPQFGPAQLAPGARPHDLPGQHRDAPQPTAGQRDRRRVRPEPGRAQRVGLDHRTGRRREDRPAHRVPGRRRAERHRQRAAHDHRRHHALPHPQRDHRFAIRPVGPGEQPGGEHGGQRAEQQQCRGENHGGSL